MSCHFHMLRRRRLAKARQKPSEALRRAETVQAVNEHAPAAAPPHKGARSRKRGDAQ